jgi:hypothetical protein
MADEKRLTDEEIEAALEGATAGHRLAEHEPDEQTVDLAHRQLRGELTADEAVEQEIKRTLEEFKRD